MDAEEKADVEFSEQKEEDLRTILSESPLYLDMSLLERENFMRYLVSAVLH